MQFIFIFFFKTKLPQRENTQLSSGLCNHLTLPIPSVFSLPFPYSSSSSSIHPAFFFLIEYTQMNHLLRIFSQVICVRLQAINCVLLPFCHKYKAIIFNANSCWAGLSKMLCPGTHVRLFSPSSSAFLIVFLLCGIPHIWQYWGWA